MSSTIPVERFPFFNRGKEILEREELSIDVLDNDQVYNDIISDATNDIIDAFKENKITPIKKMKGDRYETIKFYLTLYILKSMPSSTLYRYWHKAYSNRFEFILNDYVKDITNISTLLEQLKIPHKFLRLENLEFLAIKLNDYLDFEILIKPNEKRYQHLKLVNCTLWKGRVFFHVAQISDFKLMILKLVQNRVHQLFDELDLQVRSKKIDMVIKQMQGYLEDVAEPKEKQRLEYGEVTPQMQIVNDKIIESIKEKPGSIEIAQFPPCINILFNKLLKKEILRHPENLLLACYLAAKGFSKDQMVDVFMIAGNADPKKIGDNLEYILEKQLKPYNCDKADEHKLCFKDLTCETLHLTNPMSYRK